MKYYFSIFISIKINIKASILFLFSHSIMNFAEKGVFLYKKKEEISKLYRNTCIICHSLADEYLYFFCHCFGCSEDDLICKNCVSHPYTHLCGCFQQKKNHRKYDLNIVLEKVSKNF